MIQPHNEFTMPLLLDDFSGHQKDGALCLMALAIWAGSLGENALGVAGDQWCLMLRPMNSASCNANTTSCLLRIDKLYRLFFLFRSS